MATLVDITRPCEFLVTLTEPTVGRGGVTSVRRCRELATVALRNRVGQLCGEFCKQHGEKRLAAKLEEERKAYDPRAFGAGLDDQDDLDLVRGAYPDDFDQDDGGEG